MALSLRGTTGTGGNQGATAATSQAITLPTGTTTNDSVYFVVSVGAVISAPTLTAGSGWTLILTTDATGAMSTIVGYKLIVASETAPTVSWTTSGLTAWTAIAIAPGAGLAANHHAFGTVTNTGAAATTHTPGTYTAPVTALTSVILTGLRTSGTTASVAVTNTPSNNWVEPTTGDQSTASGTVRQQGAHLEYRLGLVTGAVTPSAITHSVSSFAIILHAFIVEGAAPVTATPRPVRTVRQAVARSYNY